MSTKFEARLVRGNTYFLGEKRFDRGVWLAVSAEEVSHLKKHAVDRRTVPATDDQPPEDIRFQKFEFREAGEVEDASLEPEESEEEAPATEAPVKKKTGGRRRR